MKKLIVMATLFLGLGGFIYFYEIQGQDAREKAAELEESLFRLESEDEVSGLTIRRVGQEAIVLAKEADTWMLKSPVSSVADDTAVSALLGRISEARREREIDDAADLAQFGLDGEMTQLDVTTPAGQTTLALGSKAFESSQMYARLGAGGAVFVTSEMLRGAVDKEVADWRDKTLLRFERSNLEAVRNSSGPSPDQFCQTG